MASPNDFPGAKKGDRLTVGNIRRWISGANRGSQRRLDAIESPSQGTLLEPAEKVFAINTSSTNIPAGAPVSLERVTDVSTAGLFNARCFNVVLLESATTAPINAGVAVDLIPYGEAGEIYISGVCLAMLTDANAGLISAAGLSTLWQAATSGSRWAMVRFGGGTASDKWVQIIGGNALASGVETIQYSGTVTPAAVYDPDVDTVYPTGLGNGYLFTDGVLGGKVLVRHNFAADQTPLLSGRMVRVNGTETLTYSGTAMTAYRIYWM